MKNDYTEWKLKEMEVVTFEDYESDNNEEE